MNTNSETSPEDSELDKLEDAVDPRVQIELERLNTATDDINKLEVDLDEARARFRQLLSESTVRIDTLAKRLGSCIEKARPYYDARVKAKEALLETQKAAARFERASSAHAAAKEMVYLAEEGLKAEGRTFDHAWQEMLNHATMRVNESETERTLGEAEHRRTSQAYHRAETRVQQLQKELKRAIAKSSLRARRSMLQINSLAIAHDLILLPYFELKAQLNTTLEAERKRVRGLEKDVSNAKASYSKALSCLERISDEIHRTRRSGSVSEATSVDRSLGPSPCSIGDIDGWSGSPSSFLASSTLGGGREMGFDDNGEEEFLKLPERLGPSASPIIPKDAEAQRNNPESRGRPSGEGREEEEDELEEDELEEEEEEEDEEEGEMVEVDLGGGSDDHQHQGRANNGGERSGGATRGSSGDDPREGENGMEEPGCGKRGRGSVGAATLTTALEALKSSNPTERVRELLSQGMMMLNISQSTPPQSPLHAQQQTVQPECRPSPRPPPRASLRKGASVFGSLEPVGSALRRASDPLCGRSGSFTSSIRMSSGNAAVAAHASSSGKGSQSGTVRKVPSPLERTFAYLSAGGDDDSTATTASDSDSLASVEMLTDEQISSLMLYPEDLRGDSPLPGDSGRLSATASPLRTLNAERKTISSLPTN
ncbi:SH3 domain-binding protein 5-like isoform X2 [Ischnura elegans]|uniref:SH3 domain-binding protein 5-like isoform X2 n=1 Tax=Ischnura elegans TaxID=197161 RepID=UPI001ED874A9|nr:SH3 domain-binding protein 5-like isoform X2 [Ischnura elegans]